MGESTILYHPCNSWEEKTDSAGLSWLQVIETDPEPAHSIIEENHQDLQIQISANVNFAQYECQKYDIRFKETLVYQTRVFE